VKAVTNAGPLIHLSWIDHLDLLPALFAAVLAPLAVQNEVLRASPDVPGVLALREAFASDWLTVQAVADSSAVATLRSDLDPGEAEAIVLMRETWVDLLLLDERRARALAQLQGLPITGTIGILRMARNRGLIPAVTPLLEDLRRRGFRVSTELVEQIRREEAIP
jgi:predicted nucleic acid-binding protein